MNTIDDTKLEEVTGGKDRKAFRFTCPNCNHSFQVDPQYFPLLDYSDLPQEKPENPTLTKLK